MTTASFLAVVIFIFLSSGRDITSEIAFKFVDNAITPYSALLIFAITTEVMACTGLLVRPPSTVSRQGATNDIISLNFWTLIAFLFYFLAIKSAIGASLNSFVDYGSGPIFTALVASNALHLTLNRRFFFCAFACVLGIMFLAIPLVNGTNSYLDIAAGITLSLLSSYAGAVYTVRYKLILEKGFSKAFIIAVRLPLLIFFLSVYHFYFPEKIDGITLFYLVIFGVIGFSIPLFLSLTAIQGMDMRYYVMILFLLPALTYLGSIIVGTYNFYWINIIGISFIIVGVATYFGSGSGWLSRRLSMSKS